MCSSVTTRTQVEFEEAADKQDEEKSKMKKLLNMSVNEIELSVRAANCLNNAKHHHGRPAGDEERAGNAQVSQFRQEIAE